MILRCDGVFGAGVGSLAMSFVSWCICWVASSPYMRNYGLGTLSNDLVGERGRK